MAISKKGFRKIDVDGETFYWKIRKKISHEEAHNDQYGVPIQHQSEGQLLIAYVGFCRSEGYGRQSVNSVTPSVIKRSILEAIGLGWKFDIPGKPISLVNGTLTVDTLTASWGAG